MPYALDDFCKNPYGDWKFEEIFLLSTNVANE